MLGITWISIFTMHTAEDSPKASGRASAQALYERVVMPFILAAHHPCLPSYGAGTAFVTGRRRRDESTQHQALEQAYTGLEAPEGEIKK